MRLNKIRLIFFSNEESEIKQFVFNLKKGISLALFAVLALTVVFALSTRTNNKIFPEDAKDPVTPTIDFFKTNFNRLQSAIESFDSTESQLEDDGENFEVLTGSRSINNETDIMMASASVDHMFPSEKVSTYLDNLEEKFKKAKKVQDIIEKKYLLTDQEIKHIPSIRPVQGAKITDKFGKRKDPFMRRRVKHHNGIDLSSGYGAKIYAAADGVVEVTRTRYRLNKGYGRIVIIDHGFGYKTLYGHLSKVRVKRGQKVKRWHVIGLSGDTGRATGPHLHYEVWRNGYSQNPEEYMLN